MIDFDRRYVLVPVLIGIAFVAAAFAVSEFGRERLIDSVGDNQKSQQRGQLLVEVQSVMADAEAGQRGFVLTGDESYLLPYEDAKRGISGYVADIQTNYAAPELGAMQQMATRLIELCSSRLTEMDSTIALYRRGPREAMNLVRTNIGLEKMDQLRVLITAMRARERQRAAEQTNDWLKIHSNLRVLSIIGSLLNVVLILFAGYLVTKEIRRRTNVAADLESRVKQQTRELSELSTHLQRASETEKFALARELHDELGGLLIAIKMDLAQLRAKLDLTHADVLRRWERIQSALSAGIDLKRRIIEQLRPSLLDNMGLIAAVQWQAEAICSAAGLQLTESFPETEPTIDPEAAIAVFRIAQEALTNIVKHARASNVRVEIANVDDELRLIVADDGAGFSPGDNTKVGAHGIKSMRHRLLPFDGTFAMEAVEPQGTRIRIALPLRRAADPLRAVS